MPSILKRQPKPWFSNRDRNRIAAFRRRHPDAVANLVCVRIYGDRCSIDTDWNLRQGLGTFDLKRRLEDPCNDWLTLATLACRLARYDEGYCRVIVTALQTCTPTRTCRLTIDRTGFALRDFANSKLPATLVERSY